MALPTPTCWFQCLLVTGMYTCSWPVKELTACLSCLWHAAQQLLGICLAAHGPEQQSGLMQITTCDPKADPDTYMQASANRKAHHSLQKAVSYWQMLTMSSAFRNWRETCWVSPPQFLETYACP